MILLREVQRDDLVDMYVNHKMSLADIANLSGSSPQTIHKRLIRFGIPGRPRAEGIRLASDKIRQSHLGKPSPLKGKRCPSLSGPKNGMWGKHHTNEAREKQRRAWKYEKHFTPEARRKMGESHRGERNYFYSKHWSDDRKQALRNKLKGRHLHPVTEIKSGQHISQRTEFTKGHLPWNTGNHLPEELKTRLSNANKGKHPSVEVRQKLSESHKKLWWDPVFVAEQMKARSIRPTKPEKQLEAILNKHLPEFKYNGDGSLGVTLGGLTPDFVNIDGKKVVIEVFGDYYHSPEVLRFRWQGSELGKIMIYNSLGWECLVIWEHELQDEQKVIDKICHFVKDPAK